MRQLSNRTRLALLLTGTTAIVTAAPTTAFAHHDVGAVSPFQASTLDFRIPLNVDVYHAFLDERLDSLEAKVATLKAAVAAIPADSVLAGNARLAAKAKLAKIGYLGHVLDALPTTGAYALTATEAAQVARIRATIEAVAAKLKALLANVAAVTPTTTKVSTLGLKELGLFDGHRCDGHWGDRSWDGWRFDRTRWGDFRWHRR